MSSVLYDVPGPKAIARNRIIAVITVLLVLAGIAWVIWRFAVTGQFTAKKWELFTYSSIWALFGEATLNTLAAFAAKTSIFNRFTHEKERAVAHLRLALAQLLADDMLLITGPVTENMKLALKKTYDAVPSPKIVIAWPAAMFLVKILMTPPSPPSPCRSPYTLAKRRIT